MSQFLFAPPPHSRYIAPMADKYHCTVCGKEETQCACAVREYCIVCQGADDVRLCEDGLYYCVTCREACDYEAQYQS